MIKNIMLLTIVVGITFLGCAQKRQKVTLVEESRIEVVEVVQQKAEEHVNITPKVVIRNEDLNIDIVEDVELEEARKKREFQEMIESTPLILKNKSSERAYE
jgi:hypothetical protein